MGIPYCFYFLTHKYDDIILNDINTCNRLFLDFNGIIHTISQKVLSQNSQKDILEIEEIIFKSIVDHTIYITTICPPKTLLYIAVDGIAPRAKQNQQRRRRYISRYIMDQTQEFKKKNNIDFIHFDTNAISPGTKFMYKLDTYINEYFNKNKMNFSVIISGHEEIGEGEHKLITYIKNNSLELGNDIIYGLDADLIMLSLSCCNQKIYLMRESSHFNKEKTEYDFKYLDISILRKSISKHLYDSDNISYMYDYIFICMFVGNDFLPGLSFLKIKDYAIDILCDNYKKIHALTKQHIIIFRNNQYSINKEFLEKFFTSIEKLETTMMINITRNYYNERCFVHKNPDKSINNFISNLENYPILNKYKFVIDPKNDNLWRNTYYNSLFHIFDQHVIKSSCINWIESLIWTVNYYFNKKIDDNWYYEWDYSPCVSDLMKYNMIISDIEWTNMHNSSSKKNIITNTDIQLLLVLPPQSLDLIDIELRPIITNLNFGCVQYYPNKFIINTYLKKYLWECIPQLPNINIDKIISAYSKIKNIN